MNTQANRTAPVDPVSLFALRERYFWQSRAMLRDTPQLTDLHGLARSIRKCWNTLHTMESRRACGRSSESTPIRG